MRAEFLRGEEAPKEVVGAATWTGASVEVEPRAEGSGPILERIFRPTPVVVDDAALRSFGTRGEVVLQPGTLRWFLAAAGTRGEAEGLKVRFVSAGDRALGWDPAGAYRTFTASAERIGAGPAPGVDRP